MRARAAGCTAADALTCIQGYSSPVRGARRNVPAGQYRVVAESLEGARRRSHAPATRAARMKSTVCPEGPIEGAGRPESKRDGGAGRRPCALRGTPGGGDWVLMDAILALPMDSLSRIGLPCGSVSSHP